MNGSGFDQMVQRLAAHRLSRRAALRATPGALAATAFGMATTAVSAQGTPSGEVAGQATPEAGGSKLADDNSTLFVQTAGSGTFKPNPKAGTAAGSVRTASGTPTTATHGTHVLSLQGHTGETIAFSDRPQRNFGEVKTSQFFKSMGFTPFDPPNAALVTDVSGHPDTVVLLELMTPAYDPGTQTLTYEANLLQQYPNARGNVLEPLAAKAQSGPLPDTFGSASLFIDDCPNQYWNCYTPAGFVACLPLGGVTGGTCWDWYALSCIACSDMDAACNAQYSGCDGNCMAYTMEEAEDQGC